MRNLKILCLALSAATVMCAFAGFGTAGATVLCTEAKTLCPNDFAAGTGLTTSLKSGSSATLWTAGASLYASCSVTSISGTTSNTGGKGTAVKAPAEWSFGNCTPNFNLLKNGELEITHIAGTHNGTVFARNYEFEMETIFGKCSYAPPPEYHLGTLVGGAPAILKVNGAVARTGGSLACPPGLWWQMESTVTSPNPLYVESE